MTVAELSKREQKMMDRIEELEEMVRIFTTCLHVCNPNVHKPTKDWSMHGGARMMMASMGRATLAKKLEL